MPLLILLPLACFVLLVIALQRRLPAIGFGEGPYPAVVVSAILLGGFTAVATELLSLPGWFSFWPVTGAWLVLLGAMILLRRRDAKLPAGEQWDWKLPGMDGWRSWGAWAWLATGVVVLLALLVAMSSPPNTHDALSYHLPRQLRWMEMGQVRHFATNDMRELSFPPLAEYLQCHTMLLTSTDLLVHLPQWAAYALAVLASAFICRALGYSRAAPLAALLVACQPIAWIQSASPKNDPVLVFLLVALAWLTTESLIRRRAGVPMAVLIGLTLGLAALTKSTAVLLAFPICLLIAAGWLWQHRAGAIWKGGIIAAVAMTIAAGHMIRNVDAFGHPLGPLKREEGGFSLSMERHDPAGIGSNTMRNLALHAMLNSQEQVDSVERVVRSWHGQLSWNPDDPQTTWGGGFDGQVALQNEGRAPAPIHVVLIAACLPMLLLRVRRGTRGDWLALALWGCGVLAFILFVSAVKWNPWHARLHSPIVALLSAPVAIGLLPRAPRRLGAVVSFCVGAPVVAFLGWAVAVNVDRPAFGNRSVLANPGSESNRWRSILHHEHAWSAVDSLWKLPEGPVAVLAGDQEYDIMRYIRLQPGRRPLTGLDARLGTSDAIDPRWKEPMAVVSGYHAMPVEVFGDRTFVRQDDASAFNLYAPAGVLPARNSGEPIEILARYSALESPSDAGRMAQPHAGWGTAFGLVLPSTGLDIPVPGDGRERVLLMCLRPVRWPSPSVKLLLDDGVLLELEKLPWKQQSAFEALIPPLDAPGVLRLRFSDDEHGPGREAAWLGWLQMPTEARLRSYDAQRTGSP